MTFLRLYAMLGCIILLIPNIFAQPQDGICGTSSNNGDLLPPTNFAFAMYNRAIEISDGNIFFSPVSISLAVGMLYQGSHGNTANEIQNVYFPSLGGNQVVPAFTNLMRSITRTDKPYSLDTANAVYPRSGLSLDGQFESVVKNCFSSEVEMKPFASETEKSRSEINNWVESKTRSLIKDFFPPGIITPSTQMVLVNAIYFKGTWLEQFDKTNTQKKMFHGLKEPSKIDMMHLYDKEFSYFQDINEGYQVLELPYKGKDLSMVIVLPGQSTNFGLFEKNLTSEKLNMIMRRKYFQQMDTVAIPKFKVEYELPLKSVMKAMGARDMFDAGRADFSGITGRRGLFVSDAVHKAVIEVNEQGSEAAAATGFVMMESAAFMPEPKPSFIANSPFMYFIVQPKAELILFMGKYQ